MCGGTSSTIASRGRIPGLSPHVRGNLRRARLGKWDAGSIPACAGEPHGCLLCVNGIRVYPRMCGGTSVVLAWASGMPGLSPHVRGNPVPSYGDHERGGSIPACAGEPAARVRVWTASWVYPRMCGGTALNDGLVPRFRGLSPHVRGNHLCLRHPRDSYRSIPACAGEPIESHLHQALEKVYPRMCGGTCILEGAPFELAGLSPHVRGNLFLAMTRTGHHGSIPACAGEPVFRVLTTRIPQVYPRMCGGTIESFFRRLSRQGLSPHVRGNPAGLPPADRKPGSIPACAGEPCSRGTPSWMSRVYPRMCGGTEDEALFRPQHRGLSPHVRGNRRRPPRGPAVRGSIPACAGEPRYGPRAQGWLWVYPRMCGGTGGILIPRDHAIGLSPHVRGNRRYPYPTRPCHRSIPACAGEPPTHRWSQEWPWVYPRMCGGTAVPVPPSANALGLSPHVRGNHD